MKSVLPLIVLIIFFASCKSQKANSTDSYGANQLPTCIKQEIEKMKAEEVHNPPSSVYQYDYRGKKVYYIPPYCCDIFGRVLDENCNLICNPDGGITGKGDGNCTDFFEQRSNKKLVWEDKR